MTEEQSFNLLDVADLLQRIANQEDAVVVIARKNKKHEVFTAKKVAEEPQLPGLEDMVFRYGFTQPGE